MSPEVLARKLERLSVYLTHLEHHRDRSAADIRQDPYAVERLLELVVQVALDIVAHLLSERGVTPARQWTKPQLYHPAPKRRSKCPCYRPLISSELRSPD